MLVKIRRVILWFIIPVLIVGLIFDQKIGQSLQPVIYVIGLITISLFFALEFLEGLITGHIYFPEFFGIVKKNERPHFSYYISMVLVVMLSFFPIIVFVKYFL